MKEQKIEQILTSERQHRVDDGKFHFLEKVDSSEYSDEKNLVKKVQSFLKKYGNLYYLLIQWFSPVLASIEYRKKLNLLLKEYGTEHVIINLGSGPRCLKGRDDIINVDIFGFHEVNVVADAADLPFKDESVDLMINTAMLEHTSEPLKIIKEMHRVLRKGGKAFCFVPFMQPLHAAPDDFYRWTEKGIYESFSEFDELQVYIAAGPMSGFLWIFVEWISILLSFGSRHIRNIFFLIFMVLTSPLKILDLFMIKLPYARNIASGFGIVAKKCSPENNL